MPFTWIKIAVVDSRLKFLHRQNHFLRLPLRWLLCNALIQPLFTFSCTNWFLNISKRLKLRLQVSQNKCIRFCLQLDKIRVKEFLQLNWLNVNDVYLQFIVSDIFKFQRINVLTILMNFSGVIACSSNKKLKLTFRKTKLGIESLSYVGPNTWNSHSGNLKSATSVISCKHYTKEYFLKKLFPWNEICNFFKIHAK